MSVERGVVILPDHEMSDHEMPDHEMPDAMFAGDLTAEFNPKAHVQVSGDASVDGSETGNPNGSGRRRGERACRRSPAGRSLLD